MIVPDMESVISPPMFEMTRLKIFVSTASALLACSIAFAQDFMPLPEEYDGSMMPYDFSGVDKTYSIPDSLEAVYVSYVARHGARYLSSEKKIQNIEKVLHAVESKGQLSLTGEALLSLLKNVSQATDGRWGQLSSLGIREERELGEEMLRIVPGLLAKGKAVSISTFVPRVVMSAYVFNHTIELPNHGLELYVSSGHQNDSLLYFFDLNPEYKAYRDSGAWEAIYDDFVSRHVSSEPARRLFTNGYKDSDARMRNLTMDLYSVLQGCRAGGFDPPTTQWMTADEYRGCWLASNLKHYLRNTPNDLNPSCLISVSPLVERIIGDAEDAIGDNGKSDCVRISGYFGHAETLLPLFSVLQLPGFHTDAGDYENLDKYWRLQDLTPLGANVTLFFMRPKKHSATTENNDVYVSVRLNGRIVEPFPGSGTVVSWPLLKERWLGLIGR